MTRKSALCLTGWHTYRPARTDDGQPYKRCVRCGKDHDGTPGGFDNYGGMGLSSPST